MCARLVSVMVIGWSTGNDDSWVRSLSSSSGGRVGADSSGLHRRAAVVPPFCRFLIESVRSWPELRCILPLDASVPQGIRRIGDFFRISVEQTAFPRLPLADAASGGYAPRRGRRCSLDGSRVPAWQTRGGRRSRRAICGVLIVGLNTPERRSSRAPGGDRESCHMGLSIRGLMLLVLFVALILALFARLGAEALFYVGGPTLGAAFTPLLYRRDRSALITGGMLGGLCQGPIAMLVFGRSHVFPDSGLVTAPLYFASLAIHLLLGFAIGAMLALVFSRPAPRRRATPSSHCARARSVTAVSPRRTSARSVGRQHGDAAFRNSPGEWTCRKGRRMREFAHRSRSIHRRHGTIFASQEPARHKSMVLSSLEHLGVKLC